MKIALDFSLEGHAPNLYREGISKYNFYLFDALLKIDPSNEIEIWCLTSNLNELLYLFHKTLAENANRISFMCADTIEALRQKVKTSSADVSFTDLVPLTLFLFSNCPKVFMLHDLFTIPLRDAFKEVCSNIDHINKTILSNLKLYAQNGTNFVTSSSFIRNNHLLKFVEEASKNKTTVIPFPPMIKNFKSDNSISEKNFKHKFNIKTPYIVYASQNRPNKNLIVLLRALKRLKEKNINIKLVTTGKISLLPSNQKYVDEHNIQDMIIEIGSISEPDLYFLYKYSNLAVIPTIIEGNGISSQCLEALSVSNIPIIMAKAWGVEESLKSVGLSMKTADLNWFDLDDDETLAQKIKDVLNAPALHIEKQKHILSAYTKRKWEDTARDYMKVFKKAIKENKKHPYPALNALPDIPALNPSPDLSKNFSLPPLKEKTTKKPKKKKFFGFYSVKQKDNKKTTRYVWGLIKKEKSPSTKKIYFCGIRIFLKKINEDRRIISFLGLPLYKQILKNGKKKRYLFGIKIYQGKTQPPSPLLFPQTQPNDQTEQQPSESLKNEQLFLRIEGIKIVRERLQVKK